ncbi:hypothetical protein [Hymenobacter sp.]|jgi:hypothetical protein|uniref:hypothetical protein n=1 Tax=Hymenobacter sp. TaxID=1898978 RepID=UPI002EDBAB3B
MVEIGHLVGMGRATFYRYLAHLGVLTGGSVGLAAPGPGVGLYLPVNYFIYVI